MMVNERQRQQMIEKLESLAVIAYKALERIKEAMLRPDANTQYLSQVAESLRKTMNNCGDALALLRKKSDKQRRMDPITKDEIQSIDWDELSGEI